MPVTFNECSLLNSFLPVTALIEQGDFERLNIYWHYSVVDPSTSSAVEPSGRNDLLLMRCF